MIVDLLVPSVSGHIPSWNLGGKTWEFGEILTEICYPTSVQCVAIIISMFPICGCVCVYNVKKKKIGVKKITFWGVFLQLDDQGAKGCFIWLILKVKRS